MTETPQDESEPPAPAITEAWWALWAWACGPNGQRRDWNGGMVKVEMRAAHARGVPYRLMWETLAPLTWDLSVRTRDVLGELINLNRATDPPGGLAADVMGAILRGDYEALRAAYGTTSTVPVQRTAPEATDDETSN